MADIKELIEKKYGIDLKKDNLVKLYKIDSADISEEALEVKIADRRKKWNQSINGANEKFAERDRIYLEKADKYEEILRDPYLRKELFDFYKGKKTAGEVEVSQLVKKYFGLISLTTKVGKSEVEFFLKYFPGEKKNKKSILEYLKKEYKILIAPIHDKDDEEIEVENEKKKETHFVVNLFSEKTLMKLRSCELNFSEAKQLDAVIERYPEVKNSLYEYLQMGKYKSLNEFKDYIAEQRTAMFNVRNDFGSDFVTLVDLFNGLFSVVDNADVRDNFKEFKLLVMYPALTPYMYEIGEIKKDSLNELYNIANEEYRFPSVTDFLASYFNVVYDNFGIYENSIKKMMKDAEKQAGKEKTINAISAFMGISRTTAIPKHLRLVYILSYWPIHILAFVFRLMKLFVDNLRFIGVGLGVLLSLLFVFYGTKEFGDTHFFTNGWPWWEYLAVLNGFESTKFLPRIFSSVQAVIKILFMYCGIGGVIGFFFWKMSVNMRKDMDLIGLERSISAIIENAKQRIIEQDKEDSDGLLKKKLPMIISNIVALGALIIGAILLL